jgi:hypothetical protein
MDPFLSNVLAGVVANGLWAAFARFTDSGPPVQRPTELRGLVEQAISSLELPPDLDIGLEPRQVESFLNSPEIAALVRQVFATHIAPKGDASQAHVHSELTRMASLHFGRPPEALISPMASLLDAILRACDQALDEYIEGGSLFAHEKRSALRHRLLADELEAINKNLHFLAAAGGDIDVPSILEFERRYREQIALRHGFIIPPHFDSARRVPIDQLFVSPHLQPSRPRAPITSRITLTAFLQSLTRAILLGNPGAGKSTLASKICHDLALGGSPLVAGQAHATPIVVILRQYGAARKERSVSILQFIEETASADCQAEPPDHFFEYLLLNGRAIVIFDGLDELLDTSYRQSITSDVELFCNLYPSIPVLVTSRVVGYESAPLDPRVFEMYRLADFEEDQVADYARKWFATDEQLAPNQCDKMAESFIRQSAIAPDLRSNPLTLALMCNIFRGENYIPRNRPAIYDKCATMLFERWDRGRGILVALPFEDHIDSAMKHLAFWIYSDEALQGGVTESALVHKATEYLYPRRFDDEEEAEGAARQFIQFCTGRAWVFTDTGTTSEGERLYQFTHRTFLEYFAAAHLVRTNATTAELFDVLVPRILTREWDVVAQLAVQLMSKRLEGAADQFLSLLLDEATRTAAPDRWNVISFAARCLQFLVPNPATTRRVTLDSFETLVQSLPQSARGKRLGDLLDLVVAVLHCSHENTKAVGQALLPQIEADLVGRDDHRRAVALDLALIAPYVSSNGIPNRDIAPLPFDLRERALTIILDAGLHARYLVAAWEAVNEGKVPLESLVNHFGVEALFTPPPYLALRIHRPTIAGLLMADGLGIPGFWVRTARDPIANLEYLGQLLPALPPPWSKHRIEHYYLELYDAAQGQRAPIARAPFSRDASFALFALLATCLEGLSTQDRRALLQRLEHTSDHPTLQAILPILLSRYPRNQPRNAEDATRALWQDSEQARLALAWAQRKVSFAAKPKRPSRSLRRS